MYEKYKNLLVEDSKIFVMGKPSNRGDQDINQPKIVVDHIFNLGDIRKTLPKTINIKIPYYYKDSNILELIKKNSLKFPGNHPIVLYLENSRKQYDKIKLSDVRISADNESIKSLRQQLDQAIVRIGI